MARLQFPVALAVVLAWGAVGYTEDPRCEAPAEWFPATPKVPLDFELPGGKECDFYKWAYQSFLWLTQPDDGGSVPRFLAFSSPDEVFQRTTPGFVLPEAKKARGLLTLAPRIATSADTRSIGEVLQASSNGLLIDQNGRAVYYASHVNDVFANFVRMNGYDNPDTLFNAPAAQEFPAGTLELKTSWKIMGRGDDASKFFTIQAELPSLKLDAQGKVVTDPSQSIIETVGLVGFHVVGTIKGHPEFIWATFEHADNAPDLEETTKPLEPVSSRDWTFYPRHTLMLNCNKNPIGAITLQAGTQQLSPVTPIFRHFAFGGEEDPVEIQDLNRSVHRQLPQELAVWKNYGLVGAVWVNDPAADFKENVAYTDDDTRLQGEKKLSNATMETFTQIGRQHCFRCHDTQAKHKTINGTAYEFPAKRIGVSHILVNQWFNAKEAQ